MYFRKTLFHTLPLTNDNSGWDESLGNVSPIVTLQQGVDFPKCITELHPDDSQWLLVAFASLTALGWMEI